jgi:hypothetical protein
LLLHGRSNVPCHLQTAFAGDVPLLVGFGSGMAKTLASGLQRWLLL